MFMFHRFLVFFKASRKFAFGFSDITLVTIFAWDRHDRVDGATSLIFRYWVFRFRKQIPDGLVWFLRNFDVIITQTCSPMIVQFFDTMIVASTDKER